MRCIGKTLNQTCDSNAVCKSNNCVSGKCAQGELMQGRDCRLPNGLLTPEQSIRLTNHPLALVAQIC